MSAGRRLIIIGPQFLVVFLILTCCDKAIAQRLGINTTNPQATLDVRGTLRVGGISNFISYDSLSGQIGWSNSRLWVPTNQALIRHSSNGEGLYYNNSAIEYRNQAGSPVFFTNWNSASSYFGGSLGIGATSPASRLHIKNGSSGFTPGISNLIVEGNGNNQIHFYTPDSYQSAILFEKPAHLTIAARPLNIAINLVTQFSQPTGVLVTVILPAISALVQRIQPRDCTYSKVFLV